MIALQNSSPWNDGPTTHRALLVIPWLAKPDLLCIILERSSDRGPLLSLCSAAPQISLQRHSTRIGERSPLGLPQRAGRQPASRGQMQSRPKGSHRHAKEGDGNPWRNHIRKRKVTLSFRSCREKPKSLLRCATWSRLAAAAVLGCGAQLTGPSGSAAGSGCFQAAWRLASLLRTPPWCRDPCPHVGDSTLLDTSSLTPALGPARRKGGRWPLASTSCIALNIVFQLHVLFSMKQTYRRKWTGFCF